MIGKMKHVALHARACAKARKTRGKSCMAKTDKQLFLTIGSCRNPSEKKDILLLNYMNVLSFGG
jgi:hypothetical protein